MPGPNKNFGDINADAVGSETNPVTDVHADETHTPTIVDPDDGTQYDTSDFANIGTGGGSIGDATVSPADGIAGIKTAIQNQGSNSTIVCEPGIYTGSMQIDTSVYENIVITSGGMAPGGEPQAAGGSVLFRKNSNGPMIETTGGFSGGGMWINGIAMDGNRDNYTGPIIEFDESAGHYRVTNCRLYEPETDCILSPAFNCQFTNNYFLAFGNSAITVRDTEGGDDDDNPSHLLIAENDVRDAGDRDMTGGTSSYVYDIQDGTDVTIRDEEMGKIPGIAIRLGAESGCSNVSIKDVYAEINAGGTDFLVIGGDGDGNVTQSVDSVTVEDCFVYGESQYFIDATSVDGLYVNGCKATTGNNGSLASVRLRSGASNVALGGQNDFASGINTDVAYTDLTRIKNRSFGQVVVEDNNGDNRILLNGGGPANFLGSNGNKDLQVDNGQVTVGEGGATGSSSAPLLALSNGGAGLYIDTNGDVVVVDEAGNTTVLS